MVTMTWVKVQECTTIKIWEIVMTKVMIQTKKIYILEQDYEIFKTLRVIECPKHSIIQ
jgi:hypothetical protein